MTLQGQKAVVTGGSRGIGRAIAEALSDAGAAVLLTARSQETADTVAQELNKKGADAHGMACDVTDEAAVEALAKKALELFGRVDILVNNAGIATSAPLKATTLESWNQVLAVNATGPFLTTRAFLPGMLERTSGRIVNVASIAGKMGAPYIAAYAASKHALIGLTRAVAAEVAAQGVTVNAVCPGYVATDMTNESVARIAGKTSLSEDKARKMLEKMSPQKRIYEPEEVAYQVLMLCDPRAGGINGQSIVLDGGGFQA